MASVESPLVASSPIHLLAKFQATKLIEDWHKSFDIDISNELEGIDVILLYRCDDSNLDFFTPASAAGSDLLYQKLQRLGWFYMQNKWEFEEAIKDLVGCNKILEVGCGPGFFVEKAIKELRGSSIKGIELTQSTLDRAVRKNLPVQCVDLLDLAAKGEIFDAVCSFQVLEHVSQPGDLLQAMVRVLAPGGRLIVCVPNKESFLKYQYNLLDMPPHHMTRWSVTTLGFLEKLLPLKISRIQFEPLAPYHIDGYVSAHGQHWRQRMPLGRHVLSDSKLRHLTSFLERTRFYRFLRGQSLYVVFEKV